MLFFTPQYIKQAKLYIREAQKLIAYRIDITPPETISAIRDSIRSLQESLTNPNKEIVETGMKKLDEICGTLNPPITNGTWRENVEILIVAITIALGVRTYFVQPFTIPTGSMQPTLNGIIPVIHDNPPPSFFTQVIDTVFFGRGHFHIVAKEDEVIQRIEAHYFKIRWSSFAYTTVVTDKNEYTVWASSDYVTRDRTRCFVGRQVKAGDIIANGYATTGDHVLVDKFTYHFFPPKRSDVFVFVTTGIPTQHNLFNNTSQFYIKRLAAIGGDKLRIDPPKLFINGQIPDALPFQRVMSGTFDQPNPPNGGYRGYSNGPDGRSFTILGSPKDTYDVPEKHYFALGDNSFYSSDSRDWGSVPQRNVVGRALLVYWPFGNHWGTIQ